MIVEKIMHRSLMGTEILGIRQTGDLEGRDAKRVFEIYRRLTKGASLLPPAVAFILDDECRSEAVKRDLFKLSANLALFLPRRMYENYLLNPSAIVYLCNSISGFRTSQVTVDEVRAAIDKKLSDPRYFCASDKVKTPADWLQNVDGARVLEELFRELSETRVEYEKVAHGIALTEWLIENAPGELDEVVQLLSKALSGEGSAAATTPQAKAVAVQPSRK